MPTKSGEKKTTTEKTLKVAYVSLLV